MKKKLFKIPKKEKDYKDKQILNGKFKKIGGAKVQKYNDNCRTRTCAGKAQKISSLSP